MNIRAVVPEDAPALAALHALCFKEGDRWDLGQIEGSLALPTTLGWAAADGEDIFGFLLLQKAQDEAEILSVCVHPARRDRKIGEALVQAALCVEETRAFFLEVAADNAPARRLYEKTGFTVFGVRPAYYRRGTGHADAINYRYLVNA